jgi:hypothetical protein
MAGAFAADTLLPASFIFRRLPLRATGFSPLRHFIFADAAWLPTLLSADSEMSALILSNKRPEIKIAAPSSHAASAIMLRWSFAITAMPPLRRHARYC